MVNARAIARLGTMAVGLGIGLAVAATPGVAVADSSASWWTDLFGGAALPDPAVPDLNLAISIDRYLLVSDGTVSAYSGSGDVAIAYGDGAHASAQGGTGDYALAAGSDAYAAAGGRSSGDTGANDDSAIDIGNNTNVDDNEGAFAGNGDLQGSGGTSTGDTALAGFGGSHLDANSDLSAVFGDGLYSDYTRGGSDLYDILSQFGDLPGSTASTSGGLLADAAVVVLRPTC